MNGADSIHDLGLCVSDHRVVGPLVCRTNGVSDQWSVTVSVPLMSEDCP